jgi:hypothetical protein
MPFALQHHVSSICKMFVSVLLSKCNMGSLFKHITDTHQDLAVTFLSQGVTSYISIQSSASEFHLPRKMYGGLVVSMLATGPKVRGFDPDRGRWIFKGDKNP